MRPLLILILAASSALADIPGWFREASTVAHPKYSPTTKGVALFYEERVQVEPTGKQTSTVRKAIKILNREGKNEAIGSVSYESKGSKVKDFKAWLIYPGGKTKEYSKKDFIEGNAKPDFVLYSTRKFTMINASADVDPGTVFGYEATLEEDTVFSQFLWSFQDDLPHMLSRFQLTVPAGWQADAKGYEGANIKAEVSGSTYTWEERNLSSVEREPGAPRLNSMLPRIAVSMIPPEGTPLVGGPIACFRTWKDVSKWESVLIDPQSKVTAAIEAKSSELTSGKATLIEKIRALATYVQQIRYVAISTNTSRGGGYIPHNADEVLRVAYGDCKDKANLLKTMLKTINVPSHQVAIYSGDSRFTKEDFPSPMQFNHAILAIQLPATEKFVATLDHPSLGRLLLFDPTDTSVPFGYLPDHEQNSNALISAGEEGSLIRTPQSAPSDNHTNRDWTLTLDNEGAAVGKLIETSTGQEAFNDREQMLRLSKDDYTKGVSAAMAMFMTGAVTESVETSYDEARHIFKMEARFRAPVYAKVMKGKLWMVRTMPSSYVRLPNVNKSEREQPLILNPVSFSEHITWSLPENLKLDEIPDADKLDMPFGKFQSSWKQNGTVIEATRSIEIKSAVVPVANFTPTRDLFLRFNGSGEAPIVLIKQ